MVYLDSAATTQKPKSVIDRISAFYTCENANVHRGVYDLSNRATDTYEAVRSQVADFIGASKAATIAFTKGATESINVVARSFLSPRLQKGDNIVTTLMEHHANFLPWQQLSETLDVELRTVRLNAHGDLDLNALEELICNRTKMVAVTHISNTLGTINPVETIIKLAHDRGVPVLLDAAQSVAHYPLDVELLDCDFLVFSGHKMFGPFGTGVLYTHPDRMKDVRPYNVGGGMIREVQLQGSTYAEYPFHLEAGTGNIAGVVGLGAAMTYIDSLDRKEVVAHISDLSAHANDRLRRVDGIDLLAAPCEQTGIVSFNVEDIHPHDVATALNREHIAVRAGMHCTQPLLAAMGLGATVRASFSVYNSREDIDLLADALAVVNTFWHD